MKRIAYTILLVFSLFLCNDVFAQVDLTDPNWDTVLNENFTGKGRGWNVYYIERQLTSVNKDSFQPQWMCCMNNGKINGIVTGDRERHKHVYQRTSAKFASGEMRLIAKYTQTGSTLLCNDFERPYGCQACYDDSLSYIFYTSGMLKTINSIGFGYVEVRCKVPVHPGSCAAIWFTGCGSNQYGEIDIMEYLQGSGDPVIMPRKYTNGIWVNLNSCGYNYDSLTGYAASKVEHGVVEWDSSIPDISSYHTYGCEWMPNRITWYFDGEVVNDYRCSDSIPQHPMRLLITHPIDRRGCDTVNGVVVPVWIGTDTLTVDYAKAYRLKCDCEDDVTIQTTTQLNAFTPSVKHSISIGSLGNIVSASTNSNIAMRATESIMITNEFEVPLGGKLTLITQPCPDW